MFPRPAIAALTLVAGVALLVATHAASAAVVVGADAAPRIHADAPSHANAPSQDTAPNIDAGTTYGTASLLSALVTRQLPHRHKRSHSGRGRPINARIRVALNLRRRRKEQELTQESLAELAGVHRTYVGAVERAEKNISIDSLCRLAWALGVDPQQLLAP